MAVVAGLLMNRFDPPEIKPAIHFGIAPVVPLSPVAAFVFLSAGPATNTVTIGVVKSLLGTRALVIYLSTIVTRFDGTGNARILGKKNMH